MREAQAAIVERDLSIMPATDQPLLERVGSAVEKEDWQRSAVAAYPQPTDLIDCGLGQSALEAQALDMCLSDPQHRAFATGAMLIPIEFGAEVSAGQGIADLKRRTLSRHRERNGQQKRATQAGECTPDRYEPRRLPPIAVGRFAGVGSER